MTHVVCDWFVTLNRPGRPIRYWNHIQREWVDDRKDASRYGNQSSANRSKGQRRRHELSQFFQYIDVAYFSVLPRAINCT